MKEKLIPHAQSLYNIVMDEFETVYYTNEQKYHILRYLTNMLESEEAKIYKEIHFYREDFNKKNKCL